MVRFRLRVPLLALGAAVALTACGNAGEDLGFGLSAGTGVAAVVYLDRDATATISAVDTSIAGIVVHLLAAGTHDTVATATCDASGLATFPPVPVGSYTVVVDTVTLGDSLVTTLSPPRIAVFSTGPTPLIQAALAFPRVTVAEARAAPAGRHVAILGVVLAGRQSFVDTSAHIADGSGAIRLLSVTNLNAGTTNLPGDLVAVTGVVAARDGQPVLDQARVTLLGIAGPPAVDTLGTAAAATAGGGTLDAALVFVPGAEIQDTATQGASFRVTVDDGSGPLDLMLDSTIAFPLPSFAIGDSVDATGVLVPSGAGSWRLKPRVPADVRLF
jgi:hypothetical protein